MKHIIAVVVLSLLLFGCSISNKQVTNNSPNETYKIAQQKINEGKWKQAIIQLEMLDNYYLSSPCSQKVQLDLIYAYYKNSDLTLAHAIIDRFMRFNPVHPNIDYVIYMRGLINMALDRNYLQSFFGVDRSDRDPQYAYDAFSDFSRLVHDYPNSQYANIAVQFLVSLENRLAKYEYSIASYYNYRGAWVAVVNRIERMLYDYPNNQATKDGLKLMENAYRKMKMNIQADKVTKLITNFNKN